MFNTLIAFLLSFICFCVTAQNQMKTTYDRNSVSVVLINSDNKYESKLSNLMSGIAISDKYYYNPTDKKKINADLTATNILNELTSNKIAAQSLLVWRNIETLIDRASYNLTDAEVSQLKASSRGFESVKDERWFKKLLQNNYIVVIKFHDIKTMDEVYNKREAVNSGLSILQGGGGSTYVKRSREGYMGHATAFLFRIEMNDVDYANFWKFWDNEKEHLSYNYKIKFVAKTELKTDGTQFKGETSMDLMQKFVNEGIDATLQKLGNDYNPFAAKTPIFATRPVRAKIGMKEGVKTDQLFFVYELKEKKNKELVYKRKGVVRANKVADNRQVATGNSKMTTFYKVNYGKYQEGMLLEQKRDVGISIAAGSVILPEIAYKARISYNLSKLVNTNRFTQFKLYTEGGISSLFKDQNEFFKDYADQSGNNDYLSASKLFTLFYGIGLEKDIFISSFFQLKPFVGAYIESSKYTETDKIQTMLGNTQLPKRYGQIFYMQFGTRLPLNLTHNLKIEPSISYSTRTYKNTIGVGSSTLANSYPKNIVIRGRTFIELMLRFDF
jgi:hypothetical protein